MSGFSFRPNRAYPSIPSIGNSSESHRRALEAIREAIEIHERRTRNYLDSFVRVGELVDIGLIRLQGNKFNLFGIDLDQIQEVGDLSGALAGQFLRYSGVEWLPQGLEASDITQAFVTQHEGALSIDWSQLTGVPSEFPPEAHTHAASDVTSGTFADDRIAESNVTQYESALAIDWSQLDSVPDEFPPQAHTHAAGDVVSGTFADDRIAESNVTQHQAALAIDWSQLSSVPSEFPPESHTHNASDINAGTLDDGRLSSNVPLLDATNTFTNRTTLSGVNGARLFDMVNTGADEDERIWAMRLVGNGSIQYGTRGDDGSFGSSYLLVSRTGTDIGTVALSGDAITLNGVNVTDYARKSQANTFTTTQTIGASTAILRLDATGAAENQRLTRIFYTGNNFTIHSRLDNDSGGSNLLTAARSGTTWTSLALSATSITANGSEILTAGDNISDLVNDEGYLTDINSESLGDLGDVNIGTPGSGEDGYVLAWDNGAGEFVLVEQTGGGGGGLPADPDEDALLFWDDSDGAAEWVTEIADSFLSDNVPLKDAANVFSASQTITTAGNTDLRLRTTAAAADEQNWYWRVHSTGVLQLLAVNDALSSSTTAIQLERTGTSVDLITVVADAVDLAASATLSDLDIGNLSATRVRPYHSAFQPANWPSSAGNYWSGLYFRHALSADYGSQIAVGSTGATPILATRNKTNGDYGDWYFPIMAQGAPISGSDIARLSQRNVFTGSSTVGAQNLSMVIAATNPQFAIHNTGGGTDAKAFRIHNAGSILRFSWLSDDYASATDFFIAERSGMSTALLQLVGATINLGNTSSTQTVAVYSPSAVENRLRLENSTGQYDFVVGSTGLWGLYDRTDSSWRIQINSSNAMALTATTITLNGVNVTDYARKSQSNTFTGNTFDVQGASPRVGLFETDGPTNEKGWLQIANTGDLLFYATTDADHPSTTNAVQWLRVQRTGTTINAISFPSGVVRVASTAASASAPALRIGTATATGSSGYMASMVRGGNPLFGFMDSNSSVEGYIGVTGTAFVVGSRSNNSLIFNTNNATRGTINTAGDLTMTGDVTAFSDARVKRDLKVIPDALEKIRRMHGYTFTRTDLRSDRRYTGVIAQEVELVMPELVADTAGHKTVAYGNFAGLFIEAIKTLEQRVEALEHAAAG